MTQAAARTTQDEDELLDLPFDQYSRHRIVERVADSIRQVHQRARLNVLDVGGYPCLTPRFLPPDRVTVTDVVRPGSGGRNPIGEQGIPPYICADGAALPFRSEAFDLVVSLDSLEHVPSDRRPAYVSELLRVSRGYVLLIAPFARDETVLAEQLLSEFVRVVNQEEQPQLKEHRDNGLPRMDDWKQFAQSRGLAHIAFSSGFVHNWLPMMLVKHYVLSLPNAEALHRSIDRFYNVTLQASDAREPGYRQGLLISTGGPTAVLERMEVELASSGIADRFEVIERMEQLGLLLKLADLHVASRRDDRLREDLLNKERHIQNLENLMRAGEERQRALERQTEVLTNELTSLRSGVIGKSLGVLAHLRTAVGESRAKAQSGGQTPETRNG